MIRVTRRRVLLAVLALFLGCGDGTTPEPDPPPEGSLAPGLTGIGSRWTVEVKEYSQAWKFPGLGESEDAVLSEFSVACEVVGEGGEGDGAYWVVSCRRDPPAAEGAGGYRLRVQKESPELLAIERVGDPEPHADFKYRWSGGIPYLFGIRLPKVPVEIPGGLKEAGVTEHSEKGRTTRLRRTVRHSPGSVEVLLEVISPVESHTVRQVWDPELRWWTRYERHIEGHRDLVATLVE